MLAVEISVDLVALTKAAKGGFLKLAVLLRKLHDVVHDSGDPNSQMSFEVILKKAGVSRRRAYYLIEIDRVFGQFDIPRKRLSSLGWTKLAVLSQHVTAENLNSLLDLAESCTVEELKAELASYGIEPATRFLTFRLNDGQYAGVLGALLAYGAKQTSGGGLGGKENALVKVCSSSLSAKLV
jgi:hypothetical protein